MIFHVFSGDQLLEWAMQVMKTHAERKAILEVEFIDEEGTGLGPTLEFFALVAAELQSNIFLCFLFFRYFLRRFLSISFSWKH